jgi:hypothetical protein
VYTGDKLCCLLLFLHSNCSTSVKSWNCCYRTWHQQVYLVPVLSVLIFNHSPGCGTTWLCHHCLRQVRERLAGVPRCPWKKHAIAFGIFQVYTPTSLTVHATHAWPLWPFASAVSAAFSLALRAGPRLLQLSSQGGAAAAGKGQQGGQGGGTKWVSRGKTGGSNRINGVGNRKAAAAAAGVGGVGGVGAGGLPRPLLLRVLSCLVGNLSQLEVKPAVMCAAAPPAAAHADRMDAARVRRVAQHTWRPTTAHLGVPCFACFPCFACTGWITTPPFVYPPSLCAGAPPLPPVCCRVAPG